MKERETMLRGFRRQLEERRREIAELDRLSATLRELAMATAERWLEART